ncbi:MAG: cyclase family protein [Desulfatiglans sp.]|jgi:kynurenine formamidase|nr:cyclase family protein [Thermodesulfobacteriota bacterium]MEE4351688.1 cyclase family protein [Desulfatiglans sp.]
MASKQIIDLSIPVENCNYTGFQPDIRYMDHQEGARLLGKSLGLSQDDFPGGVSLAWEEYHGITHMATHLDAPWHFGPTCEGKPAKTIDQINLEWCISDGVRLDMRHFGKGYSITVEDVKQALDKIGYSVKPLDIVLIWTDCDKLMHDPRYPEANPGMSAEATLWLIDQGVKIIGTDGYGYDMGFQEMAKKYKSGEKNALWPGHFAGREKEYWHIEAMGNLDQLPVDYGFTVSVLPIKLNRASAAWTRCVAIISD